MPVFILYYDTLFVANAWKHFLQTLKCNKLYILQSFTLILFVEQNV